MKPSTPAKAARRGFTIIELVVVIVIIATLTSVAVPRYFAFAQKARFQQAVQSVIALLSDARSRAVLAGSECVVRYDLQTGTFLTENPTPERMSDRPVELEETQEAGAYEGLSPRPFELPENVLITDIQMAREETRPLTNRNRSFQIRFYEDGRADGARLHLLSDEGVRVVIEVAPLTGRASIVEDEP